MNTRSLLACAAFVLLAGHLWAQRVRTADVPPSVRTALQQKYPLATGVTWEKEKGNYEANWGGLSKEDNSVTFTPQGAFVEMVTAMPVAQLPLAVAAYVKTHYAGAKITEAGKATDAQGHIRYEAEVKGKDLRFDDKGNYLGKD
jgi:hypothetical protein